MNPSAVRPDFLQKLLRSLSGYQPLNFLETTKPTRIALGRLDIIHEKILPQNSPDLCRKHLLSR
jgi:hypothetical protein